MRYDVLNVMNRVTTEEVVKKKYVVKNVYPVSLIHFLLVYCFQIIFFCSNLYLYFSRMAQYQLLEEEYERDHRARFIELGQVRLIYLTNLTQCLGHAHKTNSWLFPCFVDSSCASYERP